MISMIALLLWGVALLLAASLVLQLAAGQSWRMRVVVLGVPFLVGVLLLFRPHEDVFGGDDPGAYMNSGRTYFREGALFYTDELLSLVPQKDRSLFLYRAQSSPVQTQLHALRLCDSDTALQGPWFQPAYSLLSGVVGELFDAAPLYVAPFFCLLCALAVGAISLRIWGLPWPAFCAAMVMLLNPIVVWHGRCPRAEWPAAFHILCGVALLAGAGSTRMRHQLWRLTGAGVALALAPFYHAVSWGAVIPAVALCVVMALQGQAAFLIVPCIVACGAFGFAWEMGHVVEWYGLRPISLSVLDHAGILGLLIGAGFAAILWRALVVRRRCGDDVPSRQRSVSYRRATEIASTAVIAISLLLPVALYIHPLPRFMTHPLSLLISTDFRGFAILISKMGCTLGVLGLIALLLKARRNRAALIALCCLYPGMLVGNRVPDYMYGARYFLIFLMPMFALSISALLSVRVPWLSSRLRWVRVAALCGTLLWCFAGKQHLVRLTEYKGFVAYLGEIADDIKQQHGILLFEYPRIAAPLAHFHGVPTLAIDCERETDYEAIEGAWGHVMAALPERPAFFASALNTVPVSERFRFEPISTSTYSGSRLLQSRHAVPDRVAGWGPTITLYRMTARSHSEEEPASELPCRLALGGRAIGVRKFDRSLTRQWPISGQTIVAGVSVGVQTESRKQSDADPDGGAEILLFAREGGTPILHYQERQIFFSQTPLIDGWILYRAPMSPHTVAAVTIEATGGGVFVKDAYLRTTGGMVALALQGDADSLQSTVVSQSFSAAWLRHGATVLCPLEAGGMITALMHVPGEFHTPADIRLDPSGLVETPVLPATPGEWRWCAWQLSAEHPSPDFAWVGMGTGQELDPGVAGFAHDLSLLGGYLIVLPPMPFW